MPTGERFAFPIPNHGVRDPQISVDHGPKYIFASTQGHLRTPKK
jgi:hypothetical protein